jgi:tetratricopeptide (TPR) repeat protein
LDPRRRILFILLAVIVLPLLLIGLAELGLRVAGYGYSTSFFKPLRIGDEDYLVDNDKFGWRFFPPEISRSPTPMRLLAHKPPGTYRIFLLGESAALGDPEPAFGMGRYLQTLLQDRYPQTRFEVVPAAMTAINSHAVLPIARECARHEGDLWIIYMGNNEMIGPFGAITVFGTQSPPLWYVRFNLALQRTRVGQLLSNLGRKWVSRGGQHGPSWGGMQMFLKNQIAPGDRRKNRVYAAFQRNLEDILRAGRGAGVPIVLSTVAVNLKDCAPFGSLSKPNAAADQAADFEKLKQDVEHLQEQGDFSAAVAKCEQAAQYDSQYAELQFRWGQCLLNLTNAAAAKPHFQGACDDDALPFRSDSRINSLIRETASRFAGRDLLFYDAVASVAANSPTGIPGDETFYEHVHFHFDGNFRIARDLADKVAALLPAQMTQAGTHSWADQETCERDLGLTDWNRRDVFENMRRRLLHPPFTGQAANSQKARVWDARIKQLQLSLNPTNAALARTVYLQAIARAPQDFRLHMNYAAFLEATRDLSAAVTEWKQVETLLPHHYLAAYQTGRLLAEMNQNEEARQWLSRALIARPDLSEGWYELGKVQVTSGQFQAALGSFGRARQLVPGEPRYQLEIAKALIKLLRRDEAIAQLEQTMRVAPEFWEAHSLLGEELAFANRIPEARRQFEEAIKLKPNLAIAHFNLGVALVRQGHLADAKREFEEVMRLDPENPVARNALAQLNSPRK